MVRPPQLGGEVGAQGKQEVRQELTPLVVAAADWSAGMLECAGLTHPAATAIGGPEGGEVSGLLQVLDKCVLVAAPATRHT